MPWLRWQPFAPDWPLAAAGQVADGTVLAEPVDRDWGGRSAYIADPEGNRWEIAWAPGARFDGRGALTGIGGSPGE